MTPTEIQNFCRDLIAADDRLIAARCGCSCMDDGNFAAALEKAHGLGGSGIHAVVSSPTFAPSSNAAKNAVGTLRLKVAISEVPNINRKRAGAISAADAAWHIAWLINQARAHDGTMLVLDGEIAPSVNSAGDTVVYSVSFSCINQLR